MDRFIKKLVHFIAQMAWQPDPLTGEKSPQTISWNIAQKVWDTTNRTIEKVGDVADKTVEITNSVVNKVSDAVQTATKPTTPTVENTLKQDVIPEQLVTKLPEAQWGIQ